MDPIMSENVLIIKMTKWASSTDNHKNLNKISIPKKICKSRRYDADIS